MPLNLVRTSPVSAVATVLIIGNFDGVHRGHQALVAQAKAIAKTVANPLNAPETQVAALFFNPHPRVFFQQQRQGDTTHSPTNLPKTLPMIQTFADKVFALRQAGVQQVVVRRFDAAFSRLSPEQFVAQVIVAQCHAKAVIVGPDFKFGHQRAGNVAMLRELGERYGFTVHRVEDVLLPYRDESARISSTLLRHLLAEGQFAQAATWMGQPWSVTGRVIHGKKLGRTIDVPTLNLAMPAHPPTTGVMVANVYGLDDTHLPQRAVVSIGVRPTVEDAGRMLLEAHVFDWQGDAYGLRIRVELLHKLRDEAKFDSWDEMLGHIQQDLRDARAWHDAHSLYSIGTMPCLTSPIL
jgi:riboflavin kinase/FMN adenylyltransferase